MLDWRLLLGHKMRLGIGGKWNLGRLRQEDQRWTIGRIMPRRTIIMTWTCQIVASVGRVGGRLHVAALIVEVGSEVVDMYRGRLLTIGHAGQGDGDAGTSLLEAGHKWRSVGRQNMTTVASILTWFRGC